jgi:hypothetical protein
MSELAVRPSVSPRAIAEIDAVWEKYEEIKATAPTQEHNPKNVYKAIEEIMDLLSESKEFGDILNRHNITDTRFFFVGKEGRLTIEVA